MKFQIVSGAAQTVAADCLIVTLDETLTLSGNTAALDEASNGYITERISDGDITGKTASSALFHKVPSVAAKRLVIVGTGKLPMSRVSALKIVKKIADSIADTKGTVALDVTPLSSDAFPQAWWAEQIVLGIHTALYRFTTTKTSVVVPSGPEALIWLGDDVAKDLAVADAKGVGTNYARDLGNMPPNICTPSYLASESEKLSKEAGFKCKIYDEEELKEMGAGAFYSVSKGSVEPGKLIFMEYKGAGDEAAHMIMGKGITFDTGGISLKPGAKMDEMKYDMCGAASILGTMKTLSILKPAINVVAVITSAENMPAGNASKPGDVVTTLSGQTVEILNTDAEGRLVLCDALTLAIREYSPSTCVDVATLTGACMAALGKVNSGLFTVDEELAKELIEAGSYSNDRVWRLPLEEDYQSGLDSNFADIANIGGPLAG
ncbi:MAG: leucyl aminopeptidase, partial [Oleibacter sp.]|nr:leucyl aminopeptidase [Thalassolituus sp.]